jgi:hypothetical protein
LRPDPLESSPHGAGAQRRREPGLSRLARMLQAWFFRALRLAKPVPKRPPEPPRGFTNRGSNTRSDSSHCAPVCSPGARLGIDDAEPPKLADESEQNAPLGFDLSAPSANDGPPLASLADPQSSEAGPRQDTNNAGAAAGEARGNVCSQPGAMLANNSQGDEPAILNIKGDELSVSRSEEVHQASALAESRTVPIPARALRDAEQEPDVLAAPETALSFEPADALPNAPPPDSPPAIQDGSIPSELEAPSDGPARGAAPGSPAELIPDPAPRPAAKYRPRLGQRPPEPPVLRPVRRDTSDVQPSEATLDAELTVTFQPGGWGITLALLLRRRPAMAEEIKVRLGSEQYDLYAIGDDLFEPVAISDAVAALASGVAAESETSPPARWVRGGRDLHAFTGRDGVAGFVSVPRILIGQESAILCKADLAVDALLICAAVGSPGPEEVFGPGIPQGWRCFRGIRPGAATTPDNCDAVLLALVPLPDASIEFSGGIPVGRSAWLAGHAPSIRILGAVPAAGDVVIDGHPALRGEAGDWTAAGWDRDGPHTIHYAALSRTYEIAPAPDAWESWEAHTGNGVTLCGALAASRAGTAVFASIAGPVWLVGRVPGEIAQTVAISLANTAIAALPFEPVWALPVAFAGRRTRQFPHLIGPAVAPLVDRPGRARSSVRRWCSVIRDAGRDQRKSSEPDAANLWALYRQAARGLWRRWR